MSPLKTQALRAVLDLANDFGGAPTLAVANRLQIKPDDAMSLLMDLEDEGRIRRDDPRAEKLEHRSHYNAEWHPTAATRTADRETED